MSRVCFRAVSFGKAVMAVFKLAVLEEKSLVTDQPTILERYRRTYIWETSLTSLIPVDRVISAASCLYLRKGKDQYAIQGTAVIGHTGRARSRCPRRPAGMDSERSFPRSSPSNRYHTISSAAVRSLVTIYPISGRKQTQAFRISLTSTVTRFSFISSTS